MKQGVNELILTALDDPDEKQNTLGAIAPGHTGIVYDALELTQEPSEHYDFTSYEAVVEPTIFYQTKDTLNEIAEVLLHLGMPPQTAKERKRGAAFRVYHDFLSSRFFCATFCTSFSSSRRSMSLLSTMPMSSCSTDPPQKRSTICLTARTATLSRGWTLR